MYNKIILVGNLTRDIELRKTATGLSIGSTAIATNRQFKSQMGEQKDEVCFVDITFIGKTAETAQKYLHKGSQILVEGRLKFDQWEDMNNNKKSKHSISVEKMKMLGSRSEASASNNTYDQNNQPHNYRDSANSSAQKTQEQVETIELDKVPF